MSTAVIGAEQCRRPASQTGTAKLRITVASNTGIVEVEQTGDFVNTPLAECITKVVRGLKFPKDREKSVFSYPVILR
jgi:hypothetical protein